MHRRLRFVCPDHANNSSVFLNYYNSSWCELKSGSDGTACHRKKNYINLY